MFKGTSKSLLASALLFSSISTHASLITNGSFEQVVFADNSSSQGLVHNTDLQDFSHKKRGWDVFYALPGWVTSAGNGIELQKNIVTTSADGNQHIELDSHPRGSSNAAMTQSLEQLTLGAQYLLEFSYKPRTNKRNDNGINVFWYDQDLAFDFTMDTALSVDGERKNKPDWTVQSIVLTAEAESMNLSFAAFGKQNSVGGLIDNVSLFKLNDTSVTDIPEPSTFALSLFALVLISRRHLKNLTYLALKR